MCVWVKSAGYSKDTTYIRWSTPPILVKRPRAELWDIEEVRQTAVSGDRAHACKNPHRDMC